MRPLYWNQFLCIANFSYRNEYLVRDLKRLAVFAGKSLFFAVSQKQWYIIELIVRISVSSFFRDSPKVLESREPPEFQHVRISCDLDSLGELHLIQSLKLLPIFHLRDRGSYPLAPLTSIRPLAA